MDEQHILNSVYVHLREQLKKFSEMPYSLPACPFRQPALPLHRA